MLHQQNPRNLASEILEGQSLARRQEAQAAAAASGQAAIQFKDEGGNQGSSGAITSVDFVGAGVSAAAAGTALTVTIAAAAGGSVSSAAIGANLDIASTTETDVVTLSLAAGTYFVMCNLTMEPTGGAQTPDFYITDGTTYWAPTTHTVPAGITTISFGAVMVLGGTTTVKVRVKLQAATNMRFYKDSIRVAKAGATQIMATKVA